MRSKNFRKQVIFLITYRAKFLKSCCSIFLTIYFFSEFLGPVDEIEGRIDAVAESKNSFIKILQLLK